MRLDFDFHGARRLGGGAQGVRRSSSPTTTRSPSGSAARRRPRTSSSSSSTRPATNVWWSVRRDFAFPHEWQTVRIKKRQISFAWGPAGGGELERSPRSRSRSPPAAAARAPCGSTTSTFTALPPDAPVRRPPVATRLVVAAGALAARGVDGAGGGWHSDPSDDGPQWLALDFGERRELGGLVIDWERPAPRADYEVETSDDGVGVDDSSRQVRAARRRPLVRADAGDRGALRAPAGLRSCRRAGSVSARSRSSRSSSRATPNDFFAAVAKDARRGLYPRAFLGEKTSWTVVGGGDRARPAGTARRGRRLRAGAAGVLDRAVRLARRAPRHLGRRDRRADARSTATCRSRP